MLLNFDSQSQSLTSRENEPVVAIIVNPRRDIAFEEKNGL